MRVEHIVADNVDGAFRALSYTPPTREAVAYLESSMVDFRERFGDRGTEFVEATNAAYNDLRSDSRLQEARNILRESRGLLRDDAIYEVEYEHFDDMNRAMRRYVSMEPLYREAVQSNQMKGFEEFDTLDEYSVGRNDREYKTLYSGISDDTRGGSFFCSVGDDINTLYDTDKHDVLTTLRRARELIKNKLDFTDV